MRAPAFVVAGLLLTMPAAAISQDAPRPRARTAGIAIVTLPELPIEAVKARLPR